MVDLLQDFGVGELILGFTFVIFVAFRQLDVYVAFAVIFAALAAFYSYVRHRQAFWQRNGVPGPSQTFYMGNVLDLKDILQADINGHAKYGPFYGGFIFGQKFLSITDPEMLRKIFVDDFDNFVDRMNFDAKKLSISEQSVYPKMLSLLSGDNWRNTRKTISPAFEMDGVKNLLPFVSCCVDTLEAVLNQYTNSIQLCNVTSVTDHFAVDVAAAASFSLDIRAQTIGIECPFLQHARELNEFDLQRSVAAVSMLFPFAMRVWSRVTGRSFVRNRGDEFFRESLCKVLEKRRNTPVERDNLDFLQLCMNAAKEVDNTNEHVKTDDVQFALYLLALNPSVQDRCAQEIKSVVADTKDIQYEELQELKLLAAVISETLRLFPPGYRTFRMADRDWEYESVFVPKGTMIIVPIHYIHHDSANFENPEQFWPERFLNDAARSLTSSFKFLPFGAGPRNCVGWRLAQMQLKLTLARLLSRFRFVQCPQTEKMPIELVATQLLKAKRPIAVKIRNR